LLGTEYQQGPQTDPLHLPLPPAPASTFAAVNDAGSAPLTLAPGTYVGGISISGPALVTLLPGVYYLQGGGFTVSGQATVSGAGVLLINAPASASDRISVSGPASLSLSAPTSLSGVYAAYQGIALFQDPAASVPISLTGPSAVTVTGMVYAPHATLYLGGGSLLVNGNAASELTAEVIVDDVHVTGTGDLTVNMSGAAPAPSDPLLAALTVLAGGNGVDALSTLMAQTLLTEAAAIQSGGNIAAAVSAYFAALGAPPDGGPPTVAGVLANPTPANDEWLLWYLAGSLLENGQNV
jgi:hypothetical protein